MGLWPPLSLSWDAKLCKRLWIPCGILHSVHMKRELCRVDAVDKASKSSADPVAWLAETSPTGHQRTSCTDASLLVNGLNFARIELESFRCVSTEDEHISVVQLNTCDRLWAHELYIVDFKLVPLLTSHGCTIFTSALITIVYLRGTRVQQVDDQVVGDLTLSIVTRHQVDPSLVHYNGSRVYRLTRQRVDVKPVVRERIVTLTSLSRHSPPRKTT